MPHCRLLVCTLSIFGISVTLGCTGAPTVGSATVTGTFGGSPFEVGDAIALVSGPSAQIYITSSPDACADIQSNVQRANGHVLIMQVTESGGATTLPAAMYITENTSETAVFESNATDAACHVSYVPPPDGVGVGAVTIDAVIGTTLSGTFDMVLEDNAHVTGSFHPSACPAIASQSQSPSPACAP